MEGNSGGSHKEANRRISSVPPAAAQVPKDASSHFLKRKTPPPMLELPEDLKMNYKSLHQTLQERELSDKYISAVRKAYVFSDHIHEGELRKGTVKGKKEQYIVHPINVAIRVARKGCSAAAVCAALLHDTIEETHKASESGKHTPLDPSMVEGIFDGAPVAPAFAKRVAQLVILLTKPKFSEQREWIFADDPLYYQIKDSYNDTLYDQRSDAQYKKLHDSGDMEALTIKFCDNLHNLETMFGITDEQRQKNFRTMANKSLGIARLIFTRDEFAYVAYNFEVWGFKLPPTVDKAPPTDILVQFPPRAHINKEVLYSHPDPSAAYISIYGSVYDVFLAGVAEVGFPPDLGINYRLELERYLPIGLFCEQKKSLVPKSFPMHEVIFSISGFDREGPLPAAPPKEESGQHLLAEVEAPIQRRHPQGKMSRRSVRPSADLKGFTDILDKDGRLVISLADSAFTPETISLGEDLHKEFEITSAKYTKFQDALRAFFFEVLVPLLERSQSVAPPDSQGPGKP